ncbi:hypothetical protein C791_4187 [Amycolatopsis azurea DSM 43854]|uniref:Uncharacterized protein n=1 Tax=Amycolatopsis azurea DSM 43854 TaxID=1238180 RepID=M2PXI3_9PSEU|nr:hypothetical protein C791_4187 [Amycolatopsis azurea DSM 43854]
MIASRDIPLRPDDGIRPNPTVVSTVYSGRHREGPLPCV